MSYAHRRARLLPLESPPLSLLLRGHCYAVDEAVRPGYRFRARDISYLALLHTLSGNSDYVIDGAPCRLTPRSLLLLPPGRSFSETVPGPRTCHNRYLMLEGPMADTLATLVPASQPFRFWPQCPAPVEAALRGCIDAAHTPGEPPPWRLGAALSALVDALLEAAREDAGGLPALVRELVRADPAHAWTVPQLAAHLGMSESALAHRFREEAGVPPAAFVRRERCRMAAGLLGEGASVAEAAARLGFRNPYHFSRAFKAVLGMPPSALKPRRAALHRGA